MREICYLPANMRENIVVLDLEATCCNDDSFPRDEMEIIEIGAILLEPDFTSTSEFQTFVRPTRNPILTDFCGQLTTISQREVANAPPAEVAFAMFFDWLAANNVAKWGSWGNYDRKQFDQDAGYFAIPNPVAALPHFNIKAIYAKAHHCRPMGLGRAVSHMNLTFDGTAHLAIDDARNIARIVQFSESLQARIINA